MRLGSYRYAAYGLAIASEFPFHWLSPCEKAGDVLVRHGKIKTAFQRQEKEGIITSQKGEVLLFYNNIGFFLIKNGSEIIVDPHPDADGDTLSLFLLGPALGVLLHQRGILTLHASSVNFDGRAVAFCGHAGAGKSTIAASFCSRGFDIVSDDITAIEFMADIPHALPAIPRIKLWPDVVTFLGDNPDSLSRLRPDLEKRSLPVRNRAFSDKLPLGAIFVLSEGESTETEPLKPSDALIEMIRHSYTASLLSDAETASSCFLRNSRMVSTVPVYRLKRKRTFAGLPEIMDIVARTLSS